MFVSEGERRTLTVRPGGSPLAEAPLCGRPAATSPPGGAVAQPHQHHQGHQQGGPHPHYIVTVVGKFSKSEQFASLIIIWISWCLKLEKYTIDRCAVCSVVTKTC